MVYFGLYLKWNHTNFFSIKLFACSWTNEITVKHYLCRMTRGQTLDWQKPAAQAT